MVGVFFSPGLSQDEGLSRSQVFPNPHQVMGKFVLNVYHSKLKEHIAHKLQQDKNNSEQYLNDLYILYSQVRKAFEHEAAEGGDFLRIRLYYYFFFRLPS